MEVVQIEASTRETTGKKVKALRRQGLTPIHVYGRARESQSLQADAKSLKRILAQVGKTRPVSIVQGTKDRGDSGTVAFVREVQKHPVSGDLLHVDFYLVNVTEKMTADVPIVLVGEAPAVKMAGGVLNQALHSLEVECLPMELPEEIKVDVSSLDDFDKMVRVADVHLEGNVTILTDAEEMIVKVNQPRMEEEVVAAEAPAEEAAAAAEAGEEAKAEAAEGSKAEEKKEE